MQFIYLGVDGRFGQIFLLFGFFLAENTHFITYLYRFFVYLCCGFGLRPLSRTY